MEKHLESKWFGLVFNGESIVLVNAPNADMAILRYANKRAERGNLAGGGYLDSLYNLMRPEVSELSFDPKPYLDKGMKSFCAVTDEISRYRRIVPNHGYDETDQVFAEHNRGHAFYVRREERRVTTTVIYADDAENAKQLLGRAMQRQVEYNTRWHRQELKGDRCVDVTETDEITSTPLPDGHERRARLSRFTYSLLDVLDEEPTSPAS